MECPMFSLDLLTTLRSPRRRLYAVASNPLLCAYRAGPQWIYVTLVPSTAGSVLEHS